MKWITCNSCEQEFRVITPDSEHVNFCPFCGSDIEADEDEVEIEEDE
jgi:rRNA maturation endonuclease Nob1